MCSALTDAPASIVPRQARWGRRALWRPRSWKTASMRRPWTCSPSASSFSSCWCEGQKGAQNGLPKTGGSSRTHASSRQQESLAYRLRDARSRQGSLVIPCARWGASRSTLSTARSCATATWTSRMPRACATRGAAQLGSDDSAAFWQASQTSMFVWFSMQAWRQHELGWPLHTVAELLSDAQSTSSYKVC